MFLWINSDSIPCVGLQVASTALWLLSISVCVIYQCACVCVIVRVSLSSTSYCSSRWASTACRSVRRAHPLLLSPLEAKQPNEKLLHHQQRRTHTTPSYREGQRANTLTKRTAHRASGTVAKAAAAAVNAEDTTRGEGRQNGVQLQKTTAQPAIRPLRSLQTIQSDGMNGGTRTAFQIGL